MKNLTISPLDISRKAMTKREKGIKSSDEKAFLDFYTNGRPDLVFVPIAGFLEWKNIKSRSDDNPHSVPSKDWTFVYRKLAAMNYHDDEDMVLKREANGYLLFSHVFLIAFFEDAKEEIWKQTFNS